jgi:hypothetical protein
VQNAGDEGVQGGRERIGEEMKRADRERHTQTERDRDRDRQRYRDNGTERETD